VCHRPGGHTQGLQQQRPLALASTDDQQLHDEQVAEAQDCVVTLLAAIGAPLDLRLWGWEGQNDSPEQQEDKAESLCLLASMNGHFLPARVHEVRHNAEGKR